ARPVVAGSGRRPGGRPGRRGAGAVAAAAGDDGLPGRPGRAEPAAGGDRRAVRFRHDRIREAVFRRLDPAERRELRLAIARRLAPVPELFAAAAEQYLPVAAA